MKFLDQVKIYLRSGDGGAGCCSFRREKYIEFGGPDGGNGGQGGSVTIKAVDNLNTLIDFRYQQHFKAKIGHHGSGRNRSGAAGDSIHLKVPVGTQIFDETKKILLADLTYVGQAIVLAKGGDGGFGNAHYKSSTNRAPRRADKGWPGEELWVWIQLKLIADVGLVGLPNAGKSTFLSVVSAAHPKIADYPFTTLVPHLGVVKVDDMEFVLADIPGLIEGAHEGAGLGDRFLGHIERCKILIHLIDMANSNSCFKDYKTIRGEMAAYGHHLIQKKEIIVLNKSDCLTDRDINEQTAKLEKVTKQKVYCISAVSKKGVQEVLYEISKVLRASQLKTEEEGREYHPLNEIIIK